MDTETKDASLNLRIPADLRANLERLALQDRRSLSDSVRLALAQYVEDRETWKVEK